MEAAEGLAVVELDAAVRNVQGVQRGGGTLAEILAEGKIEGSVRGQVVSRIGRAREGIAET